MFDISKIKPFKEFKYWFVRTSLYTYVVEGTGLETPIAYDCMQDSFIIKDEHSAYINEHGDEIRAAFKEFLGRPEAAIGFMIELPTEPTDEILDLYDRMIYGVSLIRAKRNGTPDPDVAIPKIKKILDWLHSTDFYTTPASSKWHEVFKSGLVLHTLKVANCATELQVISKFSKVRIEDIILCALIHDWGKIGCYEPYNKNVKNDETGEWESVPAYKLIDSKFPFGHCTTSLILAQQAFVLSLDEMLALRWHHGDWDVSPKEEWDLRAANAAVPLVFMLQFADRLAITNY